MNNNVSNILYVGPYSKNPKGGVASVLKEYEKHTDGFRVVNTYYTSKFYLNMIPFIYSLLKICLICLLNKEIKIVHIHGASRGSFVRKYMVFKLCKQLNKKVIYHIHGAEYHLFVEESSLRVKKKISKMLKGIDAVVCLSNQWEKYFIDTFELTNVHVINNVVEKSTIKQKKTGNYQFCKFLFLGKIGTRKGTFDLINSIIGCKDSLKDKAKFFIGGDGDVDKLKQLVKDNELENIVEYIGWVGGEKKNDFLKKSDVLILPSYNEGLPISILEGMSYGLPVISTNVGGIPVIVKNNENGFLIEPGDIKQIENSILSFANREIDYIGFSQKSLEIVKDFYPEKVFSNLNNIYKNLIV